MKHNEDFCSVSVCSVSNTGYTDERDRTRPLRVAFDGRSKDNVSQRQSLAGVPLWEFVEPEAAFSLPA